MLSVFNHRELQAVTLAMKAAGKDLKRDINKATRDTMNPVWKGLVSSNTLGMRSPAGRVLNAGAKISAGNPPRAVAATSRRAIGKRKALVPQEHYYLYEFGVSNPSRYSEYQRRNRKGPGTHKVRRRASRGLPRRVDSGRAVYPAFAEIAPRMVSLWTQIVVKKFNDAAEEGG